MVLTTKKKSRVGERCYQIFNQTFQDILQHLWVGYRFFGSAVLQFLPFRFTLQRGKNNISFRWVESCVFFYEAQSIYHSCFGILRDFSYLTNDCNFCKKTNFAKLFSSFTCYSHLMQADSQRPQLVYFIVEKQSHPMKLLMYLCC